MVGQNIGKYRVLDRVGRGGMGTVYRALDETLHREVAIKVLNTELSDPEIAKRFRAEAITVARLSHPGIATIYELFQHDGQWLMVMEFVRGETLEQLIARAGALPAEQAAAICMQSLTALAHAHSMGVVHRDLKPANIMRTDVGDIKIMDFGIARVSGSEHLTSVGFMMGTPAYMAPEQVLGHEIDARADLYAMGVVFFRLLTGQLPFKGDTPFAMAQAQVNAPPTPITAIRQDVPSWVGDVLTRALQKGPDDRFQSATTFHEALHVALSGGVPPATYQSMAATGLVATPGQAMPTGALAPTMMSTPTGLPSGRVDRRGAESTPAPSSAAFEETTVTPAAPVRAGTVSGPVASAPADRLGVPSPPPDVSEHGPGDAIVSPADDAGPARATFKPLWVGAAAAALLLLAGGGWWISSSRAPVPEVAPEVVEAPPAPVEIPVTPVVETPAATPPPATTRRGGPPSSPAAARSGGPRPIETTASGAAASPGPGAAAGGSDPAPPVDPLPAVEISNVRLLLVEGRRASDQDVTLNLGNGHIVALAERDGTPLVTWPYTAVTAATYVHARNPRWNTELASPPDDLDVGGVFRASRHYLTLQNAEEYLILRLEDINIIQVTRELEARTGLVIRRSAAGAQN